MSLLAGILIALVALGVAVRMARSQGIAAIPFVAWSLVLAAVVSAIAAGGAFASFKLVSHPGAQLALIFASILLALGVGIWLSRLIWQRLRTKHRPSDDRV